MGFGDVLKRVLNMDDNSPKIDAVLIGDNKYQVPDSRLKMGLANLKSGTSKLYNGIKGISDKVGDKIENALFGQLMDNPVEKITITQDKNGKKTISGGVGTPIRDGGIIRDFVNGARENYTTKFNPQNLMGDDKKGFVYRLGEGLGSIGRMLESPLGRGLTVAGAVGALGGSAGDALAYGLGTTAQNQQIKANDRLYRNDLALNGIDTSNIRGFINSDVYKNISQANYRNNSLRIRQNIANAKDNTSRAKMIGDWLKTGQITPEDAKILIAQYGLTNADFQLSNDTRKTDSQIDLNQKRGEKLESDINVNNAILGGADVVRVIAPNGQIGTIPRENLENALKAGYKRL